MKLRFFSFVHASANLAIFLLDQIGRVPRAVRVWAWVEATKENLRTYNERQPRREQFR